MLSRIERRPLFSGIAENVGVPAICGAASILAYILFSRTTYSTHALGGSYISAYLVVSSLVLCGIGMSYAQATRAFKILTRTIIAFALFYIVTSHVRITGSIMDGDRLASFELNLLWSVAAACGVVGFFRPSFGLVPLIYILWQKHQLTNVIGLPIGPLDYFTLVETGSFLIIGYLVFGLFSRALPSFVPIAGNGAAFRTQSQNTASTVHPVDAIVLLAIALHFGNYLYAGLIKTTLGDSPIHWILDNRTEFLVLAAWDNNVLPVSFDKRLSGLTYELISNIRILTNLITVGIQLFAAVAIVRVRWAIWITLCYDVLHIVIFVTTGIFFWKFIVLNLAIVAALATLKDLSLTRVQKWVLASVVICSPHIFHILPSFAWLDTRSMNEVRFFAVTGDGKEYRVPSSYFLGSSITLAQNRMVWPAQGPFPTETWGTTRDFAVAQHGIACDWGEDAARPRVPFQVPKSAIREIVRRHHAQILSMTDGNGFVEYDLFPHHIFSVPWEFEEFKKLDKRLIRSYRYEMEAVCLGYRDGELTRKRMFYSTFDIAL